MDENQDDVEFELRFYEALVAKNPRFIEALTMLADIYTRVGRFREGLAVDERLALLKPTDPYVLYNLSCSYSITHQLDKALRSFKQAVNAGYDNLDYVKYDEDMDNLRKDSRFKRYFRRLQDKRSKRQNPSPIKKPNKS